jgi:hypothetical protein
VAGTFVIFTALVVASVGNYVSVAEAHVQASLSVRSSVGFTGLSSRGILSPNGTLALTIHFRIDNPSHRSLVVNTVAYKIWVEDGPTEAGLAGLGRTVVRVVNSTGVHTFFLTFLGSTEVNSFLVPSRASVTFQFKLNLTQSSDPERFTAIQNITEYTVRVLGDTSKMVWNVWARMTLDIEGVPPPTATSGSYLLGVSRVVLIEGLDLGR